MAHKKSLTERANDTESHYEYWKKSLEEEYPLNIPDHPHTPHRVRAVPDLRFEQGYLKSIQPYVRVQRYSALEVSAYEKGKGKAEGLEGGEEVVRRDLAEGEIIQIQWGRVAWITTRDQIISPLLQGVLRYAFTTDGVCLCSALLIRAGESRLNIQCF